MRALVTGAGRRLGRAMALELARGGHAVAVHYGTSAEAAEEVASQIVDEGGQAVTLQADLLDEAQCQTLLPRAVDALGGPITCLVNNASVFERDTLTCATRDSWDRHMASNLRAPFVLLQAMAAQPGRARASRRGGRAAGLGAGGQHDRPAGPEADPRFHVLHPGQVGAVDADAHRGTGAGPLDPGQCHRAGTNPEGSAANSRPVLAATRGHHSATGGQQRRCHGCAGVSFARTAVTGQMICPDGGQHLAWQTPDSDGLE